MSAKRGAESDDSSDDDDYGPAPAQDGGEETAEAEEIRIVTNKKRRKLQHEKLFVDSLPSSTFYEHSYMHRDIVTHVVLSKSLDFIVTGSCDGHVKFWKKMLTGIEFVKHYQAHLSQINDMSVSPDGQRLATTSEDRMIKFFDISCYDMTNMIAIPNFTPGAVCWISSGGRATGQTLFSRVAVADKGGSLIRIYGADNAAGTVLGEVTLHSFPVKCLDLNVALGMVVSVDSRGMIEYWSCDTLSFPDVDEAQSMGLSFQYKTDTDLYALAKVKAAPISVSVSPRGDLFVTTSLDKQLRVFDFQSGKLRRTYNESATVYAHTSVATSTVSHLSEHDLGRRLATERELEADAEALTHWNAVFDESGNFLIYSSLSGVKVLNVVTNRVVSTVGSAEAGERFLAVALYQGTPKVDTQLLLARSAGVGKSQTSEELSRAVQPDPTVFCTSFKKRRFFCISRRDPDESEEARDVLNEKPTEDERVTTQVTANSALGSEAIITTKLGEIRIKLFADACPKTVENFCTHARNGYYDNLKFHRVIKGFMVQTGDPLGDGTGGESIWGGEFADEFDRNLRHDRPFTVSMANAGPNTNGSQFFITTAPTPWLDNKHTVFGRVTAGFEVVSKIENKEVDKYDRPRDEVKMLSISIKR